ncbi:MAG: hypothetical protein ACRBC3_07845 [Burkholderiaceae bacterium]
MKTSPFMMATAFCLFSAIAFAGEKPDFNSIDTNGDGVISAEEAKVLKQLDFKEIDADEDGSISPEEYDHADD